MARDNASEASVWDALDAFYKQVDIASERLTRQHQDALQCVKGCSQCCVDDITVFDIEAENIRLHYPELLMQAEPHAPGGCAFLDPKGACRIYDRRPYVCRTQGLPLRWIDMRDDMEYVEYRDVCPLNETHLALPELAEDACWTIGPHEQDLALLQERYGAGQLQRTPLRELLGSP